MQHRVSGDRAGDPRASRRRRPGCRRGGRGRRSALLAAAAAKAKEAEAAEQEEGAEFVSLEDADAEAQGKKTEGGDVPDTDDIEVEEDESMDDAAFIQEDEEEGDPDVTDIVGDGSRRKKRLETAATLWCHGARRLSELGP